MKRKSEHISASAYHKWVNFLQFSLFSTLWSFRNSRTCSAQVTMASVLWALKSLPRASRPVRGLPKSERARPRFKLSQTFSRSSKVVLPSVSRLSTQLRSYTTHSRGEEVAREFETWINSIPIETKSVR